MCTLVVMHRTLKNFPIVVAANRDERLDRPSEPPQLRQFGILAPKDLMRGGTWIGVNKFGVFAGLTNRSDVKSRPVCMSRGEIVMQALHCRTAQEATDYTLGVEQEQRKGFNLIIADKQQMFLIRSNGEKFEHSTMSKLLIATNLGGNFSSQPASKPLPKRVLKILDIIQQQKMMRSKPNLKKLRQLLEIHDGIDGTCINQLGDNFGTKSSSVIWLNENIWHFWHRERTDLEQHICSGEFSLEYKLPIT